MQPVLANVRELNRRIYASLPWGYRVANLMLRLSYSLTETLGRVFYSLFLDQEVADMPPGGVAGMRPERLPSGYGHDFGKRLYAYVLQKVRKPDLAERALSDLLLAVANKKFKLSPGISLAQAEAYVISAASRSIINEIRSDRGRKYTKPKDVNQRNIDDFDFADPRAYKELDEMLPKAEISKILTELRRIDERAPSWLKAQLEGLSNVELADEWGVARSRITGWERDHLPEIKQVVMKYVQDAA